jgi:hypothetical protein
LFLRYVRNKMKKTNKNRQNRPCIDKHNIIFNFIPNRNMHFIRYKCITYLHIDANLFLNLSTYSFHQSKESAETDVILVFYLTLDNINTHNASKTLRVITCYT